LVEDAAGVEARLLATGPLYPMVKDLLKRVRGEGYPDLSGMVGEAEVIVVQTYPKGTIRISDFDRCFGRIPGPPDPSAFQPEEVWAGYREALGALYGEIWQLRAGAPTVVIGIDLYNSFVAQQSEAGINVECRALFDKFSDVQREVAEAHGAKWVSIYDALNGPSHDLDAVELGYIGPTDDMPDIAFYVPNEIGAEMIADALAAAGFDPAMQP
jgi:hypothetical protein